MSTHHSIGIGRMSESLRRRQSDEALAREIAAHVAAAGFEVVSHHAASFPGGGKTMVWILAESHLVVHLWEEEDFATVDLHICDYRRSNQKRAQSLAAALGELCFVPATARWREIHLEPPAG